MFKYYFNIIILVSLLFPVFSGQARVDILSSKLSGRILIQTEACGEAWYVNPINLERYYLGTPETAFEVMRQLGLGVSEKLFKTISVSSSEIGNQFLNKKLTAKLTGRIILQVEKNGEAWYVNPVDQKKYYLGRPADAFKIMRELGLGISNDNLNKIKINSLTVAKFCKINPSAKIGAELSFVEPKEEYQIGQTASVRLMIKVDQSINAVESVIKIDPKIATITEVSKQNSFLNSWIKLPQILNSKDGAEFVGGVFNPGFIGEGELMTLKLKFKANGDPKLRIESQRVLANDGQGTDVSVLARKASLIVAAPEVIKPNTNQSSSSINNSASAGNKLLISEFYVSADVDPNNIQMPILRFSTVGQVDHYEIIINNRTFINLPASQKSYEFNNLKSGKYIALVKVVDFNDNYLSQTVKFNLK